MQEVNQLGSPQNKSNLRGATKKNSNVAKDKMKNSYQNINKTGIVSTGLKTSQFYSSIQKKIHAKKSRNS